VANRAARRSLLLTAAVRPLSVWQGLGGAALNLSTIRERPHVRNVVGNKAGCGIVVENAADVASI